MTALFFVADSEPEQAKRNVAIPCPVSGKPVSLNTLSDPVLSSGVWGHGYALKTSSSLIASPLSCKVLRCDALDYSIVVQANNGLLFRIQVGINVHALMGERCEFLVSKNQKVKKGQTLFQVSPPFLKQNGIDTICLVTVLNSSKLSAIVPTSLHHCRAMDDPLMTVYV
ncbi:PTS sugar transporter subunit IIA [Alteromonas halophila]|uniref:PTS system glucose-specific EIIA component n=1 Tax=Alteromonas halophila TaxID=516698 RepID=A0A918MVH0_9ALTE|nr:PTS glucose transporter subunit IIA [Alteromonas halophila]GGW76160.1 hypothetical protein GCM10007391_05830 [Alteromonas halophila]